MYSYICQYKYDSSYVMILTGKYFPMTKEGRMLVTSEGQEVDSEVMGAFQGAGEILG